jgi:hypothetical protein
MCGMKHIPALASVLTAAAVVSLSAQSQGITLVQSETRDGKVTTTLTQMDNSHIRTETGNGIFIFDGDAQVMRMVNMEKKSYTEITKADMQKMSKQMSDAMEQMKNMPPAQRAMMEKMMAGRGMPGAGPAAAPIAYKATGSDKAGQWACAKYDGMRAADKVVELCTVEPKALGLTPGDFEVAKQLAEFMKSLMPQMANQIALYGTPAEQGFSGYPIRQSHFSNGKVTSVNELKEIKREAIPASAWQAPAGFKRESFGR